MQYTMTAGELTARAAQRASDEHIHILRVPGVADLFRTKSRSNPKESYFLSIVDGWVGCACPGFAYRKVCKHSLALVRRCAREGVYVSLPAPIAAKPAPIDDCCADLYNDCQCSRCKRD